MGEQLCILKCVERCSWWERVWRAENGTQGYRIQRGIRRECNGAKQAIIGKYRGK